MHAISCSRSSALAARQAIGPIFGISQLGAPEAIDKMLKAAKGSRGVAANLHQAIQQLKSSHTLVGKMLEFESEVARLCQSH